jgi:hypothetical protein
MNEVEEARRKKEKLPSTAQHHAKNIKIIN